MDTTSARGTCREPNVYYYQVGGKYPENSASLLEKTRMFLQKQNKQYTGSGYITFRFRVDCEGKAMKRVQVLQTDENYISQHFDKDFVGQLFSFVKTLDKWKIAKNNKGEPYSYTTFVTFKIKDGQVINIIP
jgi:hypothetical protein